MHYSKLLPSIAALVLAAPATALAEVQGGQEMDVLTHRGLETFLVAEPEAQISAASRVNRDLADKLGRIPVPTSGFQLEARVVVNTADYLDLLALVDGFGGGEVRLLENMYGFYVVDTESVQAAVAMTNNLAPAYPEGAVYLDMAAPRTLRQLPTDPSFSQQWHLNNISAPVRDINAEPAWDAGYTGNGVIMGVLEGGFQTNHPDLSANYNSAASQNGGSSSHGTAVAGVMGAVAYNGAGGVGLAYDGQISKQYFGGSTTTANAFNYRNDLNDIKNNSWGPSDDGTLHFISSVELNALANSTATGRGGLGEIFGWAAGNGGTGDRVEYDPYAASRYTIAFGAIGDLDRRASYNERGSSMFVVTQSSGNNRGIWTTDSGSGYTSGFGGTSSASPLGCGVVGVMLDANPALTWRDVQHVLAHCARQVDPGSAWATNGAGFLVSYNYGFGAADAAKAAALAANWTNVGSEQEVNTGSQSVNATIPDNDNVGLTRTVNVNQNITVEHVELVMNISHTYIGDIWIELTSPSGTKSILTKTRADSQNNMNNYVLTSVRHWNEPSQGTWTVNVTDRDSGTTGTWNNFSLNIYGYDGSGGPGLTLHSDALYAGFNEPFYISKGQPNTPTQLFYSLQAGSSFNSTYNVTLDLNNPRTGSSAQNTDANGDTSWTLQIPSTASGLTVLIQAAQNGQKSNVWQVLIN